MKLFLFMTLSLLSTSLISVASVKSKTVEAALLSSIQCSPNEKNESPIGIFNLLKREKKEKLRKLGIGIAIEGEEDPGQRVKIELKNPMEFQGSKTNHFEMCLDSNSGFITSADFEGDPESLIKKFALKQLDPNNKQDYLNLKPGVLPCNPILRLRKLGPSKFRFGCDWCNGG